MSAVHDGRCSPWVMCSCSVVRGNQIRDIGCQCLHRSSSARKCSENDSNDIVVCCYHPCCEQVLIIMQPVYLN